MPGLKGDIEIGYRAVEEFCRLAIVRNMNYSAFERLTGISHASVANWRYGSTPTGKSLAIMLRFGADVEYILSGKRKPKGGT